MSLYFVFRDGWWGGVEKKSQLVGAQKYSHGATNYTNVAARAADALRPGGWVSSPSVEIMGQDALYIKNPNG